MIKSTEPSTLLSLAPNILPLASTDYAVPWNTWYGMDLFDEYVPQTYRTTYEAFVQVLKQQLSSLPANAANRVIAGIRVNGGTPTEWQDVNEMIDYVEQVAGIEGLSVWYVRGILETYPTQFHGIWSPRGYP